ncbi:Glycosyl hydrolase family 57 [Candidatus Methylomirabilis lanthanidiphila]|uniref:Glycosyl hydrolase family 57 n=1 Tax=Candidatus Methylomirabilis lanthanidiphila TaxID=2211376 RepID=A0A564ZEJ9_9BACT|nr:DUF3536 domain-containing protein [Candidatus Methylomirabilis lanthanidiphila]VUZ83694.1 Glycosyl hydrolase family 57 [Candidatus Methylomirabilis lanthanidiphila]
MERYICIHGHFYQPPRENPWLEAIELQDSAYPYHDWNERITRECYAPNATSRILSGEGRIMRIVNNYANISFDIGPTLLAWLQEKAPHVYRAILDADRQSQKTFSGHGSALAQAHSHIILPLANRRDKAAQVYWGIRDFEHRFGRKPEGMWLPETAADIETLDILAECGIRFTILAPHQASRVRLIGRRAWRNVSDGRIDPTMAYQLYLPSRRKLNIFFYDGPISHAVAFERLLTKGEDLAHRIVSGFSDARTWPQLAHIATDGETYGHHHRFGDMALAYALHYIESNNLARLTNYGEYLERHPPTHQVQIVEQTSWSCAHGVERWRSDCGCNSGGHPGWNQAWRAPLREAMDWLRDTLAPRYEEEGRRMLKNPWAARNDYIEVILDRSPESLERFLNRHTARELSEAEQITALKLLELQRHAMLMYTSCGWFFDELSGIETVQVIQYAGRAIQLAEELFGDSYEAPFLDRLQRARSNLPEHQDGRRVYEKFVKPAMIDLHTVGAHYVMSSLFNTYGEPAKAYCYSVDCEDHRIIEAGRTKLAVGRVRVTCGITRESARLSFGVLHMGDHNLNCGIRTFQDQEADHAMAQELAETFSRADLPEVIRLLDRHFGASIYSLKSLFLDEQRKVFHLILESTMAEAEASYRQLYEHHAPLMHFLSTLGMPLPKVFYAAAEIVLNTDLRRSFQEEAPDRDRIQALLTDARMWRVELDTSGLGYTLKQTIDRLAEEFRVQPADIPLLQRLEVMVSLARALPFEVDLWEVQNVYSELLQWAYPALRDKRDQGDAEAQEWVSHFVSLGEALGIVVD